MFLLMLDWLEELEELDGRPSALYCTAILEEELEEELKEENGKGREKKTDSQPNPEPSLGESEILRSFWMEGEVASYAIPSTLLSPVSFALLWIMNSHLRCSEWSFPT